MAGTISISIEIELGWGMHDKPEYSHLSSKTCSEKNALSFILDICEEYSVPITFNIVGHLLHESCSGTHEGPYPNGWWNEDPGTNAQTDPHFYSPDIVEQITNSDVEHEICTHTYSHMLCDEMSDNVLRHELKTVNYIHKKNNIPEPVSIVTPRHQDPSYSILTENNFSVIRIPYPEYSPPIWCNKLGRVGSFIWLLLRQHPMTEINRRDGIVETYCTPHPSLTSPLLPNGQNQVYPLFRVLPTRTRQKIHKRYLITAIRKSSRFSKHVHLWTHLHNISNKMQYHGIHSGMKEIAKQRNRGKVEIFRMVDLRHKYD